MLPSFTAMFLSGWGIVLSMTENMNIRELEFTVSDSKSFIVDRNIAVGNRNIPLPDSKMRPF
jgi:hypothetical protein